MFGDSQDQENPRTVLTAREVVLWAVCLLLAVEINNVVYHYTPVSDALVYLARGREFAELAFFNPVTNWNFAPGYSLVLALTAPITAFEPGRIAAFQSLTYFAAALTLVRRLSLAGVLRDVRSARLALGLLVFTPTFWFPLGTIGPEALTGALVMLVSAALLRSRESERRSDLLGTSLWMGLLVLMRFEWLFLPFVGALVVKGRRRPVAVAWLLVCPALALGLNAARNSVMYGEPVVFSYGGGIVVYSGNNLNRDGSYHSSYMPGFIPATREAEWASLLALRDTDFSQFAKEQNSFYLRLAREAWATAPLDQLSVVPLKLGKLWAMPSHFDIYTADANYKRSLQIGELFSFPRWPWYGPWKHAVYLLLHWLLLAFVGAGFVGHWQRRSHSSENARAFFSYVAAVVSVFSLLFAGPLYGLPRFHVPVLMLGTFAAAQPLSGLFTWIRTMRK